MKNRKLLNLMTVIALSSICICGCGKDKTYEDMSKKELLEEIYSLENDYMVLLEENDNYISLLSTIDSSGSTLPAITSMSDGSGNLTFNTYDSKMIFPETWVYPESKEISSNTSIVIANNFSISPSSGWITKFNGASLELEHSSGVSGLIKVGQIPEMYDMETFQEDVIEPWFNSISRESILYSDIFVDDRMWGTQAKTPIYIDGEDAYLKAGMYGLGDYSVQYVFVYRGEKDASKDEVVDTLLNSMELLGLDVSIS